MSWKHRILGIVMWAALAPRPSAAERALSLKQIDVADAVLRQAEQEESRGNYQLAVELYRKALELQPDLRINFPLGRCHQKLNQLAEAANAFQRFLTVPCEYSPRAWCEEARGALLRLRGQLGVMRPEGPPGVSFRLDQRPVQATPAPPLWVEPGVHRLALVEQVGQRQISVQPGQELRIELLGVPAPERPRWRLLSGSALLSAGVVAMVAGAVALGVNRQYCMEEAMNSCRSRSAFDQAGWAFLGIGGALSIGGAGLLLYPPGRRVP